MLIRRQNITRLFSFPSSVVHGLCGRGGNVLIYACLLSYRKPSLYLSEFLLRPLEK